MVSLKPIGKGYGGFPIYKVEAKLYRCRKCRTEKMIETNHFQSCYPWCNVCQATTTWDCRELDFDVIIKRMEEKENVNRL